MDGHLLYFCSSGNVASGCGASVLLFVGCVRNQPGELQTDWAGQAGGAWLLAPSMQKKPQSPRVCLFVCLFVLSDHKNASLCYCHIQVNYNFVMGNLLVLLIFKVKRQYYPQVK